VPAAAATRRTPPQRAARRRNAPHAAATPLHGPADRHRRFRRCRTPPPQQREIVFYAASA
jgi:hypothetical protein